MVRTVFVILLMFVQITIAKSNPIVSPERLLAFKRAKSLDNGISISWLEQTWAKDILNDNAVKNTDLELLKTLGFKSIRLPVAFKYFESKNIPVADVLAKIDKMVKQCHLYGLKLIIDYHYGELNDNNYLTETPVIIKTWLLLTEHYKNRYSADECIF
jgi:endoglucanase